MQLIKCFAGCGFSSRHVQHRHEVDREEVRGRQIHPDRWHGSHLLHHVHRCQVLHVKRIIQDLLIIAFAMKVLSYHLKIQSQQKQIASKILYV